MNADVRAFNVLAPYNEANVAFSAGKSMIENGTATCHLRTHAFRKDVIDETGHSLDLRRR